MPHRLSINLFEHPPIPPQRVIRTPEKKLFLFEVSPCSSVFCLIPNIVIYRNDDLLAGADTQWGLLFDDPAKHYGMFQSDLYQMYAYQKRYNSPRSLLIYPTHATLGPLATHPPTFRTPADAEIRT